MSGGAVYTVAVFPLSTPFGRSYGPFSNSQEAVRFKLRLLRDYPAISPKRVAILKDTK